MKHNKRKMTGVKNRISRKDVALKISTNRSASLNIYASTVRSEQEVWNHRQYCRSLFRGSARRRCCDEREQILFAPREFMVQGRPMSKEF